MHIFAKPTLTEMGGCRCSYKNCKSATKTHQELHFFHYPVKQRVRCMEWIKNADKIDFSYLPNDQLRNKVVCGLHFKQACFTNELKKRLVHDAVPTLDEGCEPETTGTNTQHLNYQRLGGGSDSNSSTLCQNVEIKQSSVDGNIYTVDTELASGPGVQKSEQLFTYKFVNGTLVPVETKVDDGDGDGGGGEESDGGDGYNYEDFSEMVVAKRQLEGGLVNVVVEDDDGEEMEEDGMCGEGVEGDDQMLADVEEVNYHINSDGMPVIIENHRNNITKKFHTNNARSANNNLQETIHSQQQLQTTSGDIIIQDTDDFQDGVDAYVVTYVQDPLADDCDESDEAVVTNTDQLVFIDNSDLISSRLARSSVSAKVSSSDVTTTSSSSNNNNRRYTYVTSTSSTNNNNSGVNSSTNARRVNLNNSASSSSGGGGGGSSSSSSSSTSSAATTVGSVVFKATAKLGNSRKVTKPQVQRIISSTMKQTGVPRSISASIKTITTPQGTSVSSVAQAQATTTAGSGPGAMTKTGRDAILKVLRASTAIVPESLCAAVSVHMYRKRNNFDLAEVEFLTTLYTSSPKGYHTLRNKLGWQLPDEDVIKELLEMKET